MISGTLFVTYTLMSFLSLQAIVLVVLILKHKGSGNIDLLKSTRNFIIISIILGLFYYTAHYRGLIMGQFAAGPLFRSIDSLVFYLMGYCWLKLVDTIIHSSNLKMEPWKKWINKCFCVFMLLSVVVYLFLLDENYLPRYDWAEGLAVTSEVLLSILLLTFTVAYLWIGRKDLIDSAGKRYILSVSLLVNANNVWSSIVVISIFTKGQGLGVSSTLLYSVTSVFLLIINFLTIVYMYKKDFSPLFFGEMPNDKRHLSEEEMVNMTAEKYGLTQRERDVLFLACQGLTNLDIAEKLFISKYTVKRHMHNIFEKMNVSTRVEMLFLVRS